MRNSPGQAALLHVGDIVWWRGGWGSAAPKQAKVIKIEMVPPGEKEDGTQVSSVLWCMRSNFVVDLDNGHWAYGDQIYPLR